MSVFSRRPTARRMPRRLRALPWASCLALVALSTSMAVAEPEPAATPPPRVLDVARDAADGVVWTLAATGERELTLRSLGAPTDMTSTFRLTGLEADATVVAARLATLAGREVVALVAAGPVRTKYHVAWRSGREWKTLPAFHESKGDPFGISDVALTGDRDVSVTLRRGAGTSVEAWVYDCPDLAAGSGTLTPLRAGKQLPAGAASDRTVGAAGVRIRLTKDGLMTIEAADGTPIGMVELSGDVHAQALALEELRKHLESATSDSQTREPDGTSSILLEITADPAVRWQLAQWALQIAASPHVRIRRIRFVEHGRAGAPVDVSLPADVSKPGTIVDRVEPQPLRVSIYRMPADERSPARTRIRVGEKGDNIELSADSGGTTSGTAPEFKRLEMALAEAARMPSDAVGLIAAPPPRGPDVPLGDVLRVVRALHAVGVDAIQFEGSAAPRAR